MPVTIPRGAKDEIVEQIAGALTKYEAEHPGAKIDVYRQNSVSVRVRIIDSQFEGMTRIQRSDAAWKFLATIPEDSQSDISTVLLLTPDELQTSFANLEFEDPVVSGL
jgi:stress-induced morphogen